MLREPDVLLDIEGVILDNLSEYYEEKGEVIKEGPISIELDVGYKPFIIEIYSKNSSTNGVYLAHPTFGYFQTL